MNIDEQIIDLTKKWYDYVRIDHHKDRDCHWVIEIDYAYGDNPIYTVRHYGYIADDYTREFNSLEEAKKCLIGIIKECFELEEPWANDVLKKPIEWDSLQIEKAKMCKEILNNLKGVV